MRAAFKALPEPSRALRVGVTHILALPLACGVTLDRPPSLPPVQLWEVDSSESLVHWGWSSLKILVAVQLGCKAPSP